MAVLKDLIVHGASRFLNTANYTTAKGGVLAADKGVFNKLIATNAEIENLNVDELNANNLTAQNATVVGLLDVQGELHTNSWTNANIANIGGSFYISPTLSSAASSVTISLNTSVTPNTYTITVSGGSFVTSGTGITWSSGSRVMVTGSIKRNNISYPLGTCTGNLNAISSTGFTVTDIKISNVNSAIPGDSTVNGTLATIIKEFGSGTTFTSEKITISMYEIGPSGSYKPVGILLTSYGLNKETYIDIYGGVNPKNTNTTDNIPDGFTDPNVRIGYLGGLPAYTDSANNSHKPTGWGIYTDNGYFKGVIVADSGLVGGWTIDSNSIHSDTKTAWDEDKNGIYMGRYSEGNNTIFAIAGGKIQYIESEDNSVQEDTIYYEKIKQLTNDETQDGAKDYYIKNGSEYIIVEQEDRRSYFLTSDTTVKNKLYYTKNGDNYVVVDNPTGNPRAKGYYEMTLKNPKTSNWYEEIYQVVISPTGDPKQKGYYESAGPMWYIKSDGSASFGSLIVNRYGKLDVPAANITGMLTADQIEVSNLSAISTNIGSSVGQESTTNTLDVDTQIDYVLTNDERVNPNKIYYSLSLVDEEEGYVKVSNPSGNPKEQPYYEKINNSLIKLKTQKIFYKLTEDTTVVDGTDYYEFNTTPILTSDVEVNKSKDYYTVTVNSDGSFVSTLVIPNDTDNPRENKWYELNSSYDLINLQEVTGTINPKNKYWYIIDNIHSAEMSLLNAELNINANDKELLSIDSKVDSDEKIEVTNMSLSGGLSIGELILAPFDGGIAILV